MNARRRTATEEFTVETKSVTIETVTARDKILPLNRFSSFTKLLGVYSHVLRFINNLKLRLKAKFESRSIKTLEPGDCRNEALRLLIRTEQLNYYNDVHSFLRKENSPLREIPPLVNKLNVFLDVDGVLKVKSKFDRWRGKIEYMFPILLPSESLLTRMIIEQYHRDANHSGCYTLLAQLRKKFWVPKFFSTVRRILKGCLVCNRMNARTVKTNQSSYREFRALPTPTPFRYIFLDHFGPFYPLEN